MDEEKKCECGMPLTDGTTCSCQPDKCIHCCECDEDCECGCEEKAKANDEENIEEDLTTEPA